MASKQVQYSLLIIFSSIICLFLLKVRKTTSGLAAYFVSEHFLISRHYFLFFLKKWAGEVISSREKTTVHEEFLDLEKDIELRKDGVHR